MMKYNGILEYKKEYDKKVSDFLIKVCIHEFRFEDWREELELDDREQYKKNGGDFWIAIDEYDNIIGTIALKMIDEKSGMLKFMYVDCNYRGTKIAQDLMDKLMEYAMEKGLFTIELGTYTHLERAVRFYEKNGFNLKEQNGDVLIYERDILYA